MFRNLVLEILCGSIQQGKTGSSFPRQMSPTIEANARKRESLRIREPKRPEAIEA